MSAATWSAVCQDQDPGLPCLPWCLLGEGVQVSASACDETWLLDGLLQLDIDNIDNNKKWSLCRGTSVKLSSHLHSRSHQPLSTIPSCSVQLFYRLCTKTNKKQTNIHSISTRLIVGLATDFVCIYVRSFSFFPITIFFTFSSSSLSLCLTAMSNVLRFKETAN